MKYVFFALLLCLSAPAFAAEVKVDIHEYKFAPQTVTIHPGDSVTWINRDEIPHTIADKDKGYRSAALNTGDKFTHAFTKPGTYTYFCTLHPQMTGTVVVTP